MPHLEFRDKAYTLSDNELLTVVRKYVESEVARGRIYYSLHSSGFADLTDLFHFPDVGQYELIGRIIGGVSDPQVGKALYVLQGKMKELVALDDAILDWLARYAGMRSANAKASRRKLQKKLEALTWDEEKERPVYQPWSGEKEFQSFLTRSRVLLESIEEIAQQITNRIDGLIGTAPSL